MQYSRKALETEREELHKDLIAWSTAHDVIKKRLFESTEEHPGRDLDKWDGSWVSIGSLGLTLSVISKKLEEISGIIYKIDIGEYEDSDLLRPFGVIRGDKE